jgi:fatty-acid desaturase
VPVLYSFITTSWVTVVAHIPLSKHWFFRKGTYRIYNSDDYTYNSHVWQFLTWGEGYHNTHHACPWLWNNAILDKEFDISAQIIKVLGIPKNIDPRPIVSVRRGKDMFNEIAMVQKEIES